MEKNLVSLLSELSRLKESYHNTPRESLIDRISIRTKIYNLLGEINALKGHTMKPAFKVTEELVQKWREESVRNMAGETYIDYDVLAQKAAQWGADQELKACLEAVDNDNEIDYDTLYELRRPKSKKFKVFDAVETLFHNQDALSKVEAKNFILLTLSKIDEKYFEDYYDR